MVTITGVPDGWPADEVAARGMQDALRDRVVRDEAGRRLAPGRSPGSTSPTTTSGASSPRPPSSWTGRRSPWSRRRRPSGRSPSLRSGPVGVPRDPGGRGRAGGADHRPRPRGLRRLRARAPAPLRPREPPRRAHRAAHHGGREEPVRLLPRRVGRGAGSAAALLDGDEEVGRALRTQGGVKPVYVSVGHRVSLDNACAHALSLTPKYRVPETTRRADRLCRDALAEVSARPRPGT